MFTANATQALKLVGESYPFERGSEYLLTFDNHNSVNGIREFARAKHATTTYVPILLPEMRVNDDELVHHLERARPGSHELFAYPAQSNFSGVQHPLDWIEMAHRHGWDVLLDAASFTPTNRLDLCRWQPDFVVQSFYKIFGYPTGVGCLLARKAALEKLRRPWFAGGTITVASVQGDKHYAAEGEAAFEEGTPNYLALPAVEMGLEYINSIDLDVIHERVSCLTGWLIDRLWPSNIRNGAALARILRPTVDRPPWRHCDVQFLWRRRPSHRSPRGRAARERRQYLAPHWMLLQSRGRGDRAGHHRHRPLHVLPSTGT